MKPILISCFLAAALVLNAGNARSQRRVDSIPTTTGCYRQPVTPIWQALNLHSDMPFDCLLGYIYFDSLCRSLSSVHQLDSLLSQTHSWDTMRVFMRFLYRMEEYNPDLFEEYINDAYNLDTAYHGPPVVIVNKFIDTMWQVLGRKNKLVYLAVAPAIVHIHVVNVSMSYDSNAHVPEWPQPRECVQAIIVDTIKGIHLRQGDPVGRIQKLKGVNPLSAESWIDIDYSPDSPKPFSRGDNIRLGPVDTSTGISYYHCDSCYGPNALEVGKDYIVFLTDNYLDFNGSSSFFEFVPYPTYNDEGGIFPIDSSGNVLSQDDFFGYGSSVPLATFESDLRTDIQSIISH